MNVFAERINALRGEMEKRGIDAYLVETADYHQSEYVGDYFKCRAYLSGFTGSAGTLVVTRDEARLWTDGRYFVQAARQLEGSGIVLMPMGNEGIPTVREYLEEVIAEGGVLGFDGRTVSGAYGEGLREQLGRKHIRLCCQEDLPDRIWTDRPGLSAQPVWVLDVQYAGETAQEKIRRLRERMEKEGATVHILTSLDDIAWLLNIRGGDVQYNPVALAYLMVWKDQMELFINGDILQGKAYPYLDKEETARGYLEGLGIRIMPYEGIYERAAGLSGEGVLLEKAKVNYAIYGSLDSSNRVIERMNPTSEAKAVKNPVEMENMRRAHIKDGVAVTRFIYWLKHSIGRLEIDELSAAERLTRFRQEQEGFLGLSFGTISAYGANAAMCHYSATPESSAPLKAEGFYLVDSGGQYYEGTTDITRTVALGPLSREEREHFTLVLISMLRLGAVKFLHGCRGISLDYVAREPFWSRGLDFNHGTGHGVGYLLNVHERPNSFRYRLLAEARDNGVLEEGMVTSDEPGLYIEGSHGIRTENLLLCLKDEKNGYGQFMRFEFLTFVPIDLEAVDLGLMTERDVELLNGYHRQVYEKISPYLEGEEKEWLRRVTEPVRK